MQISGELENNLGRGFVLLAPDDRAHFPFTQRVTDESRHQTLLEGAQRLRGSIYVRDGAIRPEQLTPDGRHVQAVDSRSWHLLTVDNQQKVVACIRYHAHRPGTTFSSLALSQANFAPRVKTAVKSQLEVARRRGWSYVELGGWAICEELRCTTEAFRMLLAVYGLSELMGGALALSTATTRHGSSSILRRIGGRPLSENGVEIPAYYDPNYKCEMELLSFETSSPNPRYSSWISRFREALHNVPVISAEPVYAAHDNTSLLRLCEAVQSPVPMALTA